MFIIQEDAALEGHFKQSTDGETVNLQVQMGRLLICRYRWGDSQYADTEGETVNLQVQMGRLLNCM
jgi:hypothetical protein